jgi:hypothetical protein
MSVMPISRQIEISVDSRMFIVTMSTARLLLRDFSCCEGEGSAQTNPNSRSASVKLSSRIPTIRSISSLPMPAEAVDDLVHNEEDAMTIAGLTNAPPVSRRRHMVVVLQRYRLADHRRNAFRSLRQNLLFDRLGTGEVAVLAFDPEIIAVSVGRGDEAGTIHEGPKSVSSRDEVTLIAPKVAPW